MKEIKFGECKNAEEIEKTIQEALEHETIVKDDADAERWFKEAEIEGTVKHNVIVSTHVSTWNEEENGEDVKNVIITEHYVDAGSEDNIYSIKIS